MGVYVSDYFLAGLPIESWHQQIHIHNHKNIFTRVNPNKTIIKKVNSNISQKRHNISLSALGPYMQVQLQLSRGLSVKRKEEMVGWVYFAKWKWWFI